MIVWSVVAGFGVWVPWLECGVVYVMGVSGYVMDTVEDDGLRDRDLRPYPLLLFFFFLSLHEKGMAAESLVIGVEWVDVQNSRQFNCGDNCRELKSIHCARTACLEHCKLQLERAGFSKNRLV